MSVQTELQRIIQAKADIIDSIEAKGVTVPSGTTIDNLDDYVDQIQQGGGGGEWAANECFWIQTSEECKIIFRYRENEVQGITNIFNIWYQITDINTEPDDNNWTKMTDYSQTVNANKKIWLYGENSQGFYYLGGVYGNSVLYWVEFNVWGSGRNVNYTAGGHLMSLISKTKSIGMPINAFTHFFAGTAITDASNIILPNSAPDYCYMQMFYNCTALTAAPTLPATKVGQKSYYQMFYGCTALTTAPALPATTLSNSCYSGMFFGSGLTTAPALPATTLSNSCYYQMFKNCTALTAAPNLPVTTLSDSCYYEMFYNCTALTAAPALPATTMVANCYRSMFLGCTSLTTAPELLATTLTTYCYRAMFYNCANLNYVKCLATNISATGCTNNWLSGVAATGTFVKDASMSGWTTGTAGIPSGWTVETAAA